MTIGKSRTKLNDDRFTHTIRRLFSPQRYDKYRFLGEIVTLSVISLKPGDQLVNSPDCQSDSEDNFDDGRATFETVKMANRL